MTYTETIEPTRERLRRGKFESPSTDQKVDRKAWRQKDIADELGLSLAETQAYRRFSDEVEAAGHTLSMTGAYGERIGGGDGDCHTAMGRLAIRRVLAMESAKEAIEAVRDPVAARCLCAAVDGKALHAIGSELLGWKTRNQAKASAHTLVHSAIRSLAQHYGYLRIAEP